MQIEKTYPPEIEAMRQQWLALMAEAANRFMPPDPATATATDIARHDASREADDRRRHQIAEAIRPMLDELKKLEQFAIFSAVAQGDGSA